MGGGRIAVEEGGFWWAALLWRCNPQRNPDPLQEPASGAASHWGHALLLLTGLQPSPNANTAALNMQSRRDSHAGACNAQEHMEALQRPARGASKPGPRLWGSGAVPVRAWVCAIILCELSPQVEHIARKAYAQQPGHLRLRVSTSHPHLSARRALLLRFSHRGGGGRGGGGVKNSPPLVPTTESVHCKLIGARIKSSDVTNSIAHFKYKLVQRRSLQNKGHAQHTKHHNTRIP